MKDERSKPWYREPWPWIIMAGPAIVVVAGLATAVIAVKTDDGLVASDYYKQGLAINRMLDREHRARALGLAATVQFNETGDRLRVALEGRQLPPVPPRLTLLHATRAGFDQSVTLNMVAPGLYEGRLRALPAGVWRIKLEDVGGTWRLDGHWRGGAPVVRLEPAA